MANILTFALVSNVGRNDAAKQVRFAAIGTTFCHNLIRIFVVIPSIECQNTTIIFDLLYGHLDILEIELK